MFKCAKVTPGGKISRSGVISIGIRNEVTEMYICLGCDEGKRSLMHIEAQP